MKTLIVYYSYSGNNELLAKELQSHLACDIYQVVEKKKRHGFDLLLDVIFRRTPALQQDPHLLVSNYEHLIVVVPVWAGRVATPLKSFLKQNAAFINKYSFITLCGGGGNTGLPGELEKLVNKSAKIVIELKVNDLLPGEKKNKMKYTSGYRVTREELQKFDKPIKSFLEVVTGNVIQPEGSERVQEKLG